MSRAVGGRPRIPLDRGLGRSAALATIAGENFALVHVPPRLVHVRGEVGKFDFFFASRFCLGLAGAIPDAPGSALRGYVVGVRI